MSACVPEAQQGNYQRDGFLWPLNVLSLEAATSHHEHLQALEAVHGPLHYRVKPYLLVEAAMQVATSPVLLDAVEAILGPDILLWDGSYIVKEPLSGGYISWHQDLAYWGLDAAQDNDLVSAWVAITPALRTNGCMMFVAGTHRGPRLPHRDTFEPDNLLHRGQTIDIAFNDEQVTHLEMQPGQASLHHGWAVHSSQPNDSDLRRVALNLNFIRPSVRQVVRKGETATLVRGEDCFGNFPPEPSVHGDFDPANVAFQAVAEQRKHEVYDQA